jgi:acetolactate synthase-1/2/3 large subunit
MTKNISGAKFIANKIQSWGVKDVFIFQGGAITHILSEIGKNKKINYLCPHHEQTVAMAADAYSRIKGLGIGLVTSGPGATNLITGVASAYYDSIPCIFFTGQVGQFHITGKRSVRQRGYQETDVVSIFKPITNFAYQLKNVEEIDYILEKAYYLATSNRPGPVVLDIPFNLQKAQIIKKKLIRFIKPKEKKISISEKLKSIAAKLNTSKRPAVILGGGARLSYKNKEIVKFFKKKNIPILTTWPGQDLVETNYKNYFGSVGRHSHLSACNIANNADLLLTLGVRFSPKIVTKFFSSKAYLISVDIDKYELNEGLIKPKLTINTTLEKFIISKELNSIKKFNNKNWLSFCNFQKKKNFLNNLDSKKTTQFVNPYSFLLDFSKLAPKKGIFVNDTGCNLTYFMQAFKSKYGQRIISSWGNSPMGYSIAGGIGAKFAATNNQVISIIGDGSFLLNVQELQFINSHKLNNKIVVFDNKVLGNTKIGSEVYKIMSVGNDQKSGYFSPDIKKITRSFNLDYFFLKNNLNQIKIIKKFLKSKKGAVLHINIDPDHYLVEHSNI